MDSILKERSSFSDGLQKQNISSIWASVLGNAISKYTKSIKLEKNTLYVNISSAALRNELIFEKAKLIKKMNEALHHRRIDELVIR